MSIAGLLQAVVSTKRAESFSPQQVHHLQQKRLKKLLRHVFRHSAFYRQYYGEHGIKEGDIDEITPQDLPTINKQIMMDNYDDLVCDPRLKKDAVAQFMVEFPDTHSLYKGNYRVIHTSGSTGSTGIFVFGPRDWQVATALVLRLMGIPVFKKEKLVFFGATKGHNAGITGINATPRALFTLLPLSINDPLENICRDIDRFQPGVIFCYSSAADLLAREQLAGRINITPRSIICGGDPLTPTFIGHTEDAFGIRPSNCYSAAETQGFSIDCHSHRRLHLFDDWFSVQIVDDALQSVGTGEVGQVVMTNLYNYTQPLIRYRMDDRLTLSRDPCSCGWPFQVIDKIDGRSMESLWFTRANGNKEFISPSVMGEFMFPGLDKFQFIQTDANALMMKAVIPNDRERVVVMINEKMTHILEQKALQDTVSFGIEFVDQIPNDPKTGKFKLIIPYKT